MDIKLSVIIPLYNKSYSIVRALDSVLSQKRSIDELIIINDGSTDESLAIVSSFFNNREVPFTVCIIDKDNEGVAATRNLGIDKARNDYIAFLDADDYWSSDFWRARYDAILHNDACEVYSGSHYLNGKLVTPYVGEKYGIENHFFIRSIFGSLINSSKAVFKKKVLYDSGLFPLGANVAEDLYLWINIATNNSIFYDSNPSVYIEVQDDDSRDKRVGELPLPILKIYPKVKFSSLRVYLSFMLWKHYLRAIKTRDEKFIKSSDNILRPLNRFVINFMKVIIK
ncbi:glycosyltransferase family 2 protein [Pseudoalteromonas gelatinilytica]